MSTNLLLDTHALIWALHDVKKIPAKLKRLLEDPLVRVSFSSISTLEISIKIALGKLSLNLEQLLSEAQSIGFEESPFLGQHAVTMVSLPSQHGDPFDRAIIAQAISEDMTIASADRVFTAYPVRCIWG